MYPVYGTNMKSTPTKQMCTFFFSQYRCIETQWIDSMIAVPKVFSMTG